MLKEIIVSDDEYESRAALLENKVLAELFIERKEERYILGNIYKGRVTSVLPGMQAAFIDIGLDRNAFLHVSDVAHHLEDFEDFVDGVETKIQDPEQKKPNEKRVEHPSIRDLLKKGQEILVQIDKEPMDTKGPRVTAYITLPGRYLVYMPTVEHIGVSRKIEDEAERQRLKEMIEKIRPHKNQGFIVRTAAAGKGEDEFRSDIKFLMDHWEKINKRSQNTSAPNLIHEDLGLVYRVIRDIFTQEVSRFIIDSKEEYARILEFLDSLLPSLKSKVKLYEKEIPIFEEFGIEKQIKKALRQKIWLKSGGHIIINQTEALVSIDVNTGKYVGKENADETILKTNIEAVSEIARQLRLRDLGGIIICDFIDMDKEEHKNRVLKTMEDALKRDRSRTNILQITELGLVEMTRQRTKPSLGSMLCEPCPYCQGDGVVLSQDSTCISIMREVKAICAKYEEKHIKLSTSPPIAYALLNDYRERIKELELKLNIRIDIEDDPDLHMEDYRIISMKDQRELTLAEDDD